MNRTCCFGIAILLALLGVALLGAENQAVAADEGGPNISQADFRVKGTKTLIYVDGAAFHVGQRLRRDRIIRQRLRKGSAGWRVIEVRANDLQKGEDLIAEIREVSYGSRDSTDC